tara:strand:- start:676 stop:1104 length:429 start_codon:yes stop_codon:yes gene_type:complete
MKITIVKPDGLVQCDGKGVSGLALSGLADDVWAVHWDTETKTGELEKTDWSVTEITDFSPYTSAVTEYGEKYQAPPEAAAPEILVRQKRTQLLEESDWTQLPDAQLSTEKVAEWKTYRQALRDLPANTSDFTKVTYPAAPSV